MLFHLPNASKKLIQSQQFGSLEAIQQSIGHLTSKQWELSDKWWADGAQDDLVIFFESWPLWECAFSYFSYEVFKIDPIHFSIMVKLSHNSSQAKNK